MAGAISGAYVGLAKIPTWLTESLTDKGTWGCAELKTLAAKCFDIKHVGSRNA